MEVDSATPSIWVVSDGRAGIERQSLSLARAFIAREKLAVEPTIMRLDPGGVQAKLPPEAWPAPLRALPPEQREKFARKPGNELPDLWIATGRRSIPYSRNIRRWSHGKTLVVQTQDPRTDLRAYDLVVPPEHDQLTGPNVLPILGPPTWWSGAEIEAAKARFPDLAGEDGVLVSIGGDSKTHAMTEARIVEIENTLARLAPEHRLWITVSRRTPEAARQRLRKLARDHAARFWENEAQDGPNPYLAWLSACSAALVTEDSANMLADPAFFAKPTHLLRLDGRSPRFDRLHAGFIRAGSARWFMGRIERWTYPPIREAERAAAEIARLLAAKA